MESQSTMDKVRALFRKPDAEPEYARIDGELDLTDEDVLRPEINPREQQQEPFSWLEYSIFLLLGVAMLWAW